MAQILGTSPSPLPTSIGGVKTFGKTVVGFAVTGLALAGALGVLRLALPWAQKVPVLGSLFAAPASGRGVPSSIEEMM